MGDVKALRTKDISPAIVLESLKQANEGGKIDAIYVITIKDGRTDAWASGDLNQIGLAYCAFTDLVTRYIRGEVIEER